MTLAIQQPEYEERLARPDGAADRPGPHRSRALRPLLRPLLRGLRLQRRRSGRSPSSSTAEGKGGMLVPRLEREHAQANASVDHVADYPGTRRRLHPMESLRGTARGDGCARAVQGQTRTAIRGCSAIAALRSPSSSAPRRRRSPASWRTAGGQEPGRDRTDPREARSGKPRARAAPALHAAGPHGERGVSSCSTEASLAMLDAIRPDPIGPRASSSTAQAPATGARSAATPRFPTRLRTTSSFRKATSRVTGATAPVWGYLSELERTRW